MPGWQRFSWRAQRENLPFLEIPFDTRSWSVEPSLGVPLSTMFAEGLLTEQKLCRSIGRLHIEQPRS